MLSDPELLKRILRNILTNAMHYTLQGEVILKCSVTFKNILIEIIDTGIGISEHKLKEIFKELYQIDGANKHIGGGLGCFNIFYFLWIKPVKKRFRRQSQSIRQSCNAHENAI